MLTLMIGPAGAGKSTWAKNNFAKEDIFSSDNIREELFGDFRSQENNHLVFQLLHARAAKHLAQGRQTCIDATHLRWKDRASSMQVYGAKIISVTYAVINRPLQEKLQTAGWRHEVPGLVERHDTIFNNNLKYILAGDNLSFVTVKDLRQ